MRSEWKLLMLQVDHSPTTDSAVRDETENYQGAQGTILKCKSAKTCSSTQPCRFPKMRGASNHPQLDHFSIKPPMVTWGSPDFKKPLFVSEDRWLVKNIWMNPSPFLSNPSMVRGWCFSISSGWWFFHILGMSSSQLTNSIIFQRGKAQPPTRWNIYRKPLFCFRGVGLNHQPVLLNHGIFEATGHQWHLEIAPFIAPVVGLSFHPRGRPDVARMTLV